MKDKNKKVRKLLELKKIVPEETCKRDSPDQSRQLCCSRHLLCNFDNFIQNLNLNFANSFPSIYQISGKKKS